VFILALIGMFYLLDIDYARYHELGFTVLQNIIFEDKNTPGDLINVFTAAMAEYAKFKNNKTLYGALTRWGYTTTHITVQCT
jgi:hypothetical protein